MSYCYFVYGKRTAPEHWDSVRRVMVPQDKQFRPLSVKGERVTKFEDAICFAEKADAEEWINRHSFAKGVKVEVRKRTN